MPVIPPVIIDTPTVAYRGGDLSFLPEMEQANTIFYNGTTSASALDIMKSYGCNLVRVRLWHTPPTGHSGLNEVLAFCKTIHAKGMQILLDFHYSDSWADPGQQPTPAAWAALSQTAMEDSIFAYSKKVIELLTAQNTLPHIVQVGNEINGGFLWDTGKIYQGASENWSGFAALLKKGIAGVKAADTGNKIKIMIHYSGISGADYFYSHLQQQAVVYDMIGLSYYPWWHGSDLNVVQQTMNALTAAYSKPLMIVETAYPFTLLWDDNTNNVLGTADNLISAYPASPGGQLGFLEKLRSILLAVPNEMGVGFCYWEPQWVAYRGGTVIPGSSWENLALFDFENKALPGLKAFRE